MLNLFFIFLIREKRGVFINRFTLPLRLFASLINLLFYYYAAKAFKPDSNFFGSHSQWSLFEYVMIGELTLALHIDSLIIYSQQLRQIINEGVLDTLINTKKGLYYSLNQLGLSSLCFGMITSFFNLFILYAFFNFPITVALFLKALLLNLAFIPLFSAFGLISAGFLIIMRRGASMMGTFVGLLGILSGAYFPTVVFPQYIYEINLYLNPLQLLLAETRYLFNNGSFHHIILIPAVFSFGIVLLLFSKFFFNFSLNIYKRRGGPLILGT